MLIRITTYRSHVYSGKLTARSRTVARWADALRAIARHPGPITIRPTPMACQGPGWAVAVVVLHDPREVTFTRALTR